MLPVGQLRARMPVSGTAGTARARRGEQLSGRCDGLEAGPLDQLLGSSIAYRIAVGPQQGRKVFTLQKLPAWDEPFDAGVGKVGGFSLRAGVTARADERKKLERLCRYVSRPAVPERRLSLTPNGNARFQRINFLSGPCLPPAAVGR